MAKKIIVTEAEIKKDLITSFFDRPRTRKKRFLNSVDILGLSLNIGLLVFLLGLLYHIFLLFSFLIFLACFVGHHVYTRTITKNFAKNFSISDYDISVMTVDCIRDEYYTEYRHRRTYNVYNYYIRFENGNEWYLPTSLYRWSERHATYSPELYKNTHAGDKFIVVTKKADNKIVMAYNTDIFEYKK